MAAVQYFLICFFRAGSVIGETDGFIKYFLNTGSASNWGYTEQTGSSNPFNATDLGSDNTPAPWCGDIDADGDVDWFAIGCLCVCSLDALSAALSERKAARSSTS